MEKYLEAFSQRLSFGDDLFMQILTKIAGRIRAEFPIPCYPDLMKMGDDRVQLHWPGKLTGLAFDLDEAWAEFGQTFGSDLASYLDDSADEAASALIEGVKQHHFTCFYTLELPKGCQGALWISPVRLVWDYSINIDATIARYDIIGQIG